MREILPYDAALTRYLAQRRKGTSDIQDLRHDIYIRVLESAQKLRPTVPKAFLFITARNLLIDRARREAVVSIDLLGDLEATNVLIGDLSAERHAAGRQQLQRLARYFDRLPQRCREVFWMRRIEGLTRKDVAGRLQIAEATVERHLYRAVRRLTEAMNGTALRREGFCDEAANDEWPLPKGSEEPRHGE